MDTELKPCPFCGAEACGPILCDDDWYSWYKIECSECGVRTPKGLDEEECIAVWNRRPENKLLSYEELRCLRQGTPVWIEYGNDFEDGDIYLVIYCIEKLNRFVVSDKAGDRQEFECDKYGKTWIAKIYPLDVDLERYNE